jgi:hypothetical protein
LAGRRGRRLSYGWPAWGGKGRRRKTDGARNKTRGGGRRELDEVRQPVDGGGGPRVRPTLPIALSMLS